MARSCSNVKTVSAFIASEVSYVVARRGYAAASSQGAVSSSARTGSPSVMLKKGSEESAKISWVPDPVTGFYRPENKGQEIDPVELRAMFLKKKSGDQ